MTDISPDPLITYDINPHSHVHSGSIFAFNDLRGLVEALLDDFDKLTWTTQGFGMIRAYLDPAGVSRLNIWDDRLRVEGVSDIHSHPWSFSSTVIVGELHNTRFLQMPIDHDSPLYQKVTILPGPGGGTLSPVTTERLARCKREEYRAGLSYFQQAGEIHRTEPLRGTVTINTRRREGADEADVFWESGAWVDAEPREATSREVSRSILAASELFT